MIEPFRVLAQLSQPWMKPDLPLVFQVKFVSYESNQAVGVSLVSEHLNPALDVGEGFDLW